MSRSARKREQAKMRGTHPAFIALDEPVTVRFLGDPPSYEHFTPTEPERPVSDACAAGHHLACAEGIPACWCAHHPLRWP